MYRVSPTGEYRQTGAPLAAQISLVKMRELSVHKRPIYLKRRTVGFAVKCLLATTLQALYGVSVRRLGR